MTVRTLIFTLGAALTLSFSMGHARTKVKRVDKGLYKCSFEGGGSTMVTANNRREARSTCDASASARGVILASVDKVPSLKDKMGKKEEAKTLAPKKLKAVTR